MLAGAVKEIFATLQPIPRPGFPRTSPGAAVFQASNATGFVNGQDIVIDGGHTIVTRGWSATPDALR